MNRTVNTRTTRTTIKTRSFWSLCSILVLSCSIVFIFGVVITGLCVKFLVDDPLSRNILIGLIVLLIVVGVTGVGILEMHRRKHAKKKPVIKNRSQVETRYDPIGDPSAPPMSTPSTWSYQKDTFSNRSTIPA